MPGSLHFKRSTWFYLNPAIDVFVSTVLLQVPYYIRLCLRRFTGTGNRTESRVNCHNFDFQTNKSPEPRKTRGHPSIVDLEAAPVDAVGELVPVLVDVGDPVDGPVVEDAVDLFHRSTT